MKDKDYDRLKRNIHYEIELIDGVIMDLEEAMASQKELTNESAATVQKGGVATLLMNFYNGVENILKQIGKIYYRKMPTGEGWHKALLRQSWRPPEQKEAVFTEELTDRLYEYLSFRHLFFHGYGFKLKWERLVLLAEGLGLLWCDIKEAVEEFLVKIEENLDRRSE